MSNILAPAIIKLFREERFYAELLLGMNRIISTRIPTAGVRILSQVELIVNPDFFSKLTLDEQVAILKHECAHIFNEHISRSKQYAPEVYEKSDTAEKNVVNHLKHNCINIACDTAINSHINNMPEGSISHKMFNLPSNRTMEWYMGALKENDVAKHFMQLDGHDLWLESEGSEEILKEKVKALVNQAAKNAKNAGYNSAEMELLIDKLNASDKNWRKELTRFASRAIYTTLSTSRKKRNRRYGITFPGAIKEEVLHIGVAIDTSGSMSNESLVQIMSELTKMSKYANITVVEADSEIKNSYTFNPKKQYTIKGRGGTAYQPVFEWFNANEEIDALIYFGDMDCFDQDKIKKPKYPVLWAIVGDSEPPVKWGSKTNIVVKSERD